MRACVTILVDNRVERGEGLLAEHGLSMLLEMDESVVLIDTGQSDICLGNSQRLGADIGRVRTVVLSHGHYDQGGGLPALLGILDRPEIVAHPDAFAPKYHRRPGRPDRRIGLAYDLDQLSRWGAAVRLESGARELGDGLLATGAIPRGVDFEDADRALQVQTASGWRLDRLEDDQAVVARTADGNVILLGCAHAGVVNTVRHVAKLTGDDRVRAVIGGLHLGDASGERIEKTVLALLEREVGTVAACHCTGFPAAVRLHAAFGDRFVNGSVGLRLTF
jgi:7,8-dihydropterin-6-yl-methyl-4-(beta-D-ribofuranosyl)aminobenzene 5'-phosphate synthase